MTLLGHKQIIIDERCINVRVRTHSRRKTRVVMSYHPDGLLILDAPKSMTPRAIRILIYKNEGWLRKEIRKSEEGNCIVYPSKYESGTTLYLLGKPITLKLSHANEQRVVLNSKSVRVHAPSNELVPALVHTWYRDLAHRILNESVRRVFDSTQLVGTIPNWSHRYMKSRWGSCSSNGSLRLNTHLVKVPPEAIDMVVLHELCHLKEMNHGPEFYQLMSKHMPDWQSREATLGKYEQLLGEDLEAVRV